MPIEIVSQSKRETVELPRPQDAVVHPWCPENPEDKPLLYVSAHAADTMFAHCLSEKDEANEVMGLLIGELFDDEDGVQYGIVRQTATSRLEADNVSVRFADFGQLMAELDGLDYDWILLGWYHSHPGHTCFLSSTDIATHTTMFKQDHQVAIVIDPINVEAKSFIIRDKEVNDIPFMVTGALEELEGVPLHLRSPRRKQTKHGGFEPLASAVNVQPPVSKVMKPEIMVMALGILTAVSPVTYQMLTNNLQPHWFNAPTVLMMLTGYLLFLIGYQRKMMPVWYSISHPSVAGPVLMLFGLTSAFLLLILGIWRALTDAWEPHFAHYAALMAMVALVGAMMGPPTSPASPK